MSKEYDAIIAKTHTAEYSMHKYWARKPHNVLSYFISQIVPENGEVLDPFCGSGVVLHEARKLGMNAQGFDVNPVANLITNVLIDPPNSKEFQKIVSAILDKLDEEISPYYKIGASMIKYAVHATVVKCSECGTIVPFTEAVVKGRSKKCPGCQTELRFNLENLIDTKIERVFTEDSKVAIDSADIIDEQKKLSDKEVFAVSDDYNYSFETNRRILAFEGMKTRDLFTARNYSILCHIADAFNEIEDVEIRKAALLLLTASVAQCSRLIPNRNDLSTGGPAWSVPGFWVPAEHLETNPIVHIRARYKKFVKALKEINDGKYANTAVVDKIDAISGMKDYREKGKRADLIFFDPPYGDSVPYLEFSAIWNSFLKDFPPADNDISVSDRKPKNESWDDYNKQMKDVLGEISKTLSPAGKLLITFNNNDIKAWEALLNGLQTSHLVCEYVTYQIPAVVSAKAQFSLEGSYISDIYSVYSYLPESTPTSDLAVIANSLKKAAEARNGVIAKNLANRVIILEWLRNNIRADLLVEKETIIKSLFEEKGSQLILKGELKEERFDLCEHAKSSAKEILSNGPSDWNELYKTIAIQYAEYGFLDPNELRTYLDGHVIIENKRCISYLD